VDRPAREDFAAAEGTRDELDRMPSRLLEHVGGFERRPQVRIHGPFARKVRDHRRLADARFVLGNEFIVRHDIGQKVGGISEGERAVLVVARTRRDAAQRGPEVAPPEKRRSKVEPPHDGEVGQAGTGEHQPRQPRRRRAQVAIGERYRGERVFGEEKVAVQSPGMRVGRVQQHEHGEELHGRDAAGVL
jgi:hypothetical protein